MNLNSLSQFTFPDVEKQHLIDNVGKTAILREPRRLSKAQHRKLASYDLYDADVCASKPPLTKECPSCGKKYSDDENFCLDCAVKLRKTDVLDVRRIELNPSFEFKRKTTLTDFNEILSEENLMKIQENDFDIGLIASDIRKTAFRRLDGAIKENGIDLDALSTAEKIILFSKSFVDLEYKSYGPELGIYKFNRICVDDRQSDALEITTILHELSHFLLKEMLTHALCSILDVSKTTEMESVITFILSYSPVTQLVDEYAAHTVEGRFTLYGFQDYSSFLSIQDSVELKKDDIEMLKTIGNTFANIIKGILESFIDDELLSDIKDQFRSDILDRPDYRNLIHENCTLLNDKGLDGAVRFILTDGFAVSMDNIEKLEQYNEMW